MSQAAPLTVDLRKRVQALLKRSGERSAVAKLGISRQTFARVLAGMDVNAGTHALIRQRLDAIDKGDKGTET